MEKSFEVSLADVERTGYQPVIERKVFGTGGSYSGFELRPLQPSIGAEIWDVDLTRPPSPALFRELQRAWVDYKVLAFRDQHITAEQQLEFSSWWGDVSFGGHLGLQSATPGIVTLSVEKGRQNAAALFHFEGVPVHPIRALVLRCLKAPPVGGDTMCVDMAAAYDQLPEEVQAQIDGLSGVSETATGPLELPLVHVHPVSGRKTLCVSEFKTKAIASLAEDQSAQLLDTLLRQIRVPEFQCRVRWAPGTVLLIDNHSCCHYGCADFDPADRILERSYIMEDPKLWSIDYTPGTRDTMGRPLGEDEEDEFRILLPAMEFS